MKLLTNCALGAASAVPAAAAAPGIVDGVCDGKSATHIIKSYPVKDGTQAPWLTGSHDRGA